MQYISPFALVCIFSAILYIKSNFYYIFTITMKKIVALRTVLIIAIAGMLFSGYLSFWEVIRNACPLGGCSTLWGIPTCIYGFTMYTIIFIVTLIALCSKKK